MDFGLKTYLTLSDGTRIENPLFLRQGLGDLRKASRRLSRCGKSSAHRLAARLALDRIHEEITNRRDDWQWTCPQCGTTLDRYVNAATNIMRQGVASSGSPRKTKVTLRKGR